MSKITGCGIYRFFLNTAVYKAVAVCAMMLSPVIFFCFADELISIFLLAWAAFILLNDLFGERRFMKAPFTLILLAFVLSYTVTVALKHGDQISVTFNWYFWLFVQFFVLYALFDKKDMRGITEEMRFINRPITAVAALCGVAGIAVYLFRISIIFPEPSEVTGAIMFGLIRDRNFGLFNNPIPFSCAMYVGIVAAVWNLIASFFDKKRSIASEIYYIAVLVICLMALHTTFTRTYIFAAYCTVAGSAVSTLLLYRRDRLSLVKRLLRGALVGLLSLAVMGGIYAGEKLLFPKIAKLSDPQVYYYSSDKGFYLGNSESSGVVNDDVEMERTEYGEGFLGPRAKIWRISADVIPHSPIFGFTTGNRMSSSIEFDRTGYIETKHQEGIRTYDNAYIDIAVSAGLLGLVLILAFIVLNVIRTLKVYFFRKNSFESHSDSAFYSLAAVNSAVHACFVCIFMSLLIFAGNSTCIYFWVLLGYLARMNDFVLGEGKAMRISTVFDKIFKSEKKANG